VPFWSGETLKVRFADVITYGDERLIDCAAYTMRVGSEYYVTPSDQTPDVKSRSLKSLAEGEAFTIPPGQFAYLITHEQVQVPLDALGFISIRPRIKWRGLVNVSGFHVDPGYRGRLTFAVYNAGPTPIHMRQGDPTFLIWFAQLDRMTASAKKPVTDDVPGISRMDVNILNPISGELYSLEGLAKKMQAANDKVDARVTALERANGVVYVAATLVVTLCAGLLC
jgi:dCTP deaminase